MGTKTYSKLEAELREALGNRPDLNTRIVDILNDAQVRLTRMHDWDELEATDSLTTGFTSTPADDKFLSIPSSTRKIHSFTLLDGAESRNLQFVPHKLWDRKIPLPEYHTVGHPHLYTIHSGKFEFWRVPDAAYSLRLRRSKWPTVFAGSGSPNQVSDLDDKDDVILALAISIAWGKLGQDEKENRWFSRARGLIGDSLVEETEQVDKDILPAFEIEGNVGIVGDYWLDPFVRGVRG